MLDPFSGNPTFLRGQRLPDAAACAALQDDHQRRLAALARLVAAAAQCGLRADQDRDLVLLPEDEVILLEHIGGEWAELGQAIRALRSALPLLALDRFGFSATADEPFSEANAQLRYLGGGVEAWVFSDPQNSVYKFFRPREAFQIGATFRFVAGTESFWQTQSCLGSYRNLLEKLLLLNAIGGMPTEIVGVTPEGIVVVKQTLGRRLPEPTDTSRLLPAHLVPWPSRFLRCDRDHPRLVFIENEPWLVADLHERNLVRDETGAIRIIDLVAAPVPESLLNRVPPLVQWIARVRVNPTAGLLNDAPDSEL